MGGDYYEREMVAAPTPAIPVGTGGSTAPPPAPAALYSAAANAVFTKTYSANPCTTPFERVIECKNKNPIVVAIDVTGSMGDFPRIIFDKLPMFFGQIMMQGYLPDPAISFCGIGDVEYDQAPLQVTDFGVGRVLDNHLSNIWIEGNGGDFAESYEYAVLFYGYRCKLAADSQKGFLFITGDNVPKHIKCDECHQVLGLDLERDISNEEVFARCREKFNIFYLCNCTGDVPDDIKAHWGPLITEKHILPIANPKAVIDVMLGVVAIMSGKRNLHGYIDDLRQRGQSEERIAEVKHAMHVHTGTKH